MARNPSRLNPAAGAKAAVERVRAALDAAKSRTGGEGQLVALSAGGLFLAFVLLAALAPFLMRAPAMVANVIGLVLFALVFVATGIGFLAVWRIVQAGANDASAARQTSVMSQAAIEAAFSDAEDAGLKAVGSRLASDAMTGRIQGLAAAIMTGEGATYAVIRLKEAAPSLVLLSPGTQKWPYPMLARDSSLTPIPPPQGLDAQAWADNRDAGMALMARLGPALKMSAAGGEVPFMSVRGRALVMMWRGGDVGTAGVIAAEAAKAMA